MVQPATGLREMIIDEKEGGDVMKVRHVWNVLHRTYLGWLVCITQHAALKFTVL